MLNLLHKEKYINNIILVVGLYRDVVGVYVHENVGIISLLKFQGSYFINILLNAGPRVLIPWN